MKPATDSPGSDGQGYKVFFSGTFKGLLHPDVVVQCVDDIWYDTFGFPLSSRPGGFRISDSGAAGLPFVEAALSDACSDLYLESRHDDFAFIGTHRDLIEYLMVRLLLKEYEDGRLHRPSPGGVEMVLGSPVPWIREMGFSLLSDVSRSGRDEIEVAVGADMGADLEGRELSGGRSNEPGRPCMM